MQLLLWLVFYLFFSSIFYAVQLLTGFTYLYTDGKNHIVPPLLAETLIEFFAKSLLTLLLWYFFFRVIPHWGVIKTLLAQVIAIVVFVVAGMEIQHYFMDKWMVLRMTGKTGYWFDYYFPLMFYLVEFGLFYAYNFWQRTQRQMAKEKELLNLAYQSDLKALQAQIQPHFLFNTLNSISASVPPQQEKTRELIARLADTFRYSLKATQQETVPLHEEINFIKALLELEKERFRERLHFHISVNKEAENIMLPPMLLQPLVENAIKHGIAGKIEGGEITISCKLNDTLHISVSDSGLGYKGNPDALFRTAGVGLRNTQTRLQRLYGASLEVIQNNNGGLTFSFEIPVTHD